MRVLYAGPFAKPTGYAQAAHDYQLALHKAGIELDILPLAEPQLETLPERYKELIPLVNRGLKNYDVVIGHAIPAGTELIFEKENVPTGTKCVYNTTWETSVFPKEYAQAIDVLYDQCWVPSRFCYEAITQTGAIDINKVKRVPHTFDPAFWYQDNEFTKDPNAPFTFYSILTWCERKNPTGLLKAYLSEFKAEENVLLKIRTPGYNEGELNELVRCLGLWPLPAVEMLCEQYDELQMLELHQTSDCYVTAARAEGWGLGAFEAALVGNPVIATGYSGLTDFGWGFKSLPYFMTPALTPESNSNSVIEAAGIRIKPVLRNDHPGIIGNQEWAEPDLGTLKKLMRQAYNERWSKNYANRKYLTQFFSYEAVGQQMKKLLEDLCSGS